MKKAYLYVRFCTANKNDFGGYDQLQSLMAYASQNNIQIIQIFIDPFTSGLAEKQEQKALLKTLRKFPVEYLLIRDISRISRNPGQTIAFIVALEKLNVKLLSPQGLVSSELFSEVSALQNYKRNL